MSLCCHRDNLLQLFQLQAQRLTLLCKMWRMMNVRAPHLHILNQLATQRQLLSTQRQLLMTWTIFIVVTHRIFVQRRWIHKVWANPLLQSHLFLCYFMIIHPLLLLIPVLHHQSRLRLKLSFFLSLPRSHMLPASTVQRTQSSAPTRV